MARNKSLRKTHHYTAEFKLKAVKLSGLEGVQVQDVAEALDIHPFMLSRWRKEAREGLVRARVGIAPGAREHR
jgi:transposase